MEPENTAEIVAGALMLLNQGLIIMRDLRADWRKWSLAERIAAVLVCSASSTISTLLLIGTI
jgi:hypothetical protein